MSGLSTRWLRTGPMNPSAIAAYRTSVAMAERVGETPADVQAAAAEHGLSTETVWHLGAWQTFVVPTACPHQRRMMASSPAMVALVARVFAEKIDGCQPCADARQGAE
jgi:ABC-type proline/glycine betaine transport system substrate-binding protein